MFLGSGGAFESLLAPCCAARCFVRFVRFVVGRRVLCVRMIETSYTCASAAI